MSCFIMSFRNMVSLHICSSLASTYVYIMRSLDLQGFSELDKIPSSMVFGTNYCPAIITQSLSFLPVNTFTHTSFTLLLVALLLLANCDFIVFFYHTYHRFNLFLLIIVSNAYLSYFLLDVLTNFLKQSSAPTSHS